jgi:hypothetical protein
VRVGAGRHRPKNDGSGACEHQQCASQPRRACRDHLRRAHACGASSVYTGPARDGTLASTRGGCEMDRARRPPGIREVGEPNSYRHARRAQSSSRPRTSILHNGGFSQGVGPRMADRDLVRGRGRSPGATPARVAQKASSGLDGSSARALQVRPTRVLGVALQGKPRHGIAGLPASGSIGDTHAISTRGGNSYGASLRVETGGSSMPAIH